MYLSCTYVNMLQVLMAMAMIFASGDMSEAMLGSTLQG